MYFVYILKSVFHEECYIGITNNPVRRLREHNEGRTFSTKRYAPWKYVYLEGYGNKEDAEDRERKLKQFGRVHRQLMKRIFRSLTGINPAPFVECSAEIRRKTEATRRKALGKVAIDFDF